MFHGFKDDGGLNGLQTSIKDEIGLYRTEQELKRLNEGYFLYTLYLSDRTSMRRGTLFAVRKIEIIA